MTTTHAHDVRPLTGGEQGEGDNAEAEPGLAEQTLIETVLRGGERGTAAQHEMEDRRSFYYLVALLTRYALLDQHGVPMPDQTTTRQRVSHITQNGEAWKNLY